MDIDKEIADLTRKFASLREKTKAGGEFGNLSILNLRTLSFLYFCDTPPTMRTIAEAVGISMPSVSVIFDKLEEEKLATRSHSQQDRRVVQAQLTLRGRSIIESQVHRSQAALKMALSNLTEADKKVVMTFFTAYISAIETPTDKVAEPVLTL